MTEKNKTAYKKRAVRREIIYDIREFPTEFVENEKLQICFLLLALKY